MARRNLLRSLLSASLLLGSVAAGVLAAPAPAGAAGPDEFRPDHLVIVHENYFESAWGGKPGEPATVYAHPLETVEFVLADGVSPHHTVTLDQGTCAGRPDGLCEKAFDDPSNASEHPVVFRFQDAAEYSFYDRYTQGMTGNFVITDSEFPPPTTTTTTTSAAPTTTTTVRPVTTTTTRAAPTTTTTASGSIRPLLVPDPAPTTTTVAAPKPAPTNNAHVAGASSKDKGKNNDKGKAKGAGTDTPTTVSPAPSVLPTDVIFDPSTLTPGPTMLPDTSNGDNGDEVAIDAASVVGLLDHVEKSGDEGNQLMMLALCALACLLLACGIWGWHNRSSRYDPA